MARPGSAVERRGADPAPCLTTSSQTAELCFLLVSAQGDKD